VAKGGGFVLSSLAFPRIPVANYQLGDKRDYPLGNRRYEPEEYE
jgi:hypothetical protein